MPLIQIEGGHPLKGTIPVHGAKNAALPIMAASLLCEGPIKLTNVPDLMDVETMGKVLSTLGVDLEHDRVAGTLHLSSPNGVKEEAPYELVKTMRASFFVMGPLLARAKKARVPLPGGCAIGVRPVNIHLKGFEALGAQVRLEAGCAVAEAPKLVGNRILLDFPSVGATENLMMAATLAEGDTTIENAAREPEIADLAGFLNAMGARITGAGTGVIQIQGVPKLHGCEYRVIPDRIEAGTFLVLGALLGDPLVIDGCHPSHLESVIAKVRETGARVEVESTRMTVWFAPQPQALEIKTLPYPGFPTDMQAQMMVLMSLANGTSTAEETVFENRFMHVAELARMGANLTISNRTVVIKGVPQLVGAPVMASDLRAGAALVLAGLVARGVTEISRIYHIDRGYQGLEERLAAVGGVIRRVDGGEPPPPVA